MLLGKQKLLVTSENNPCTQVGSQQTNQTVPQRRKKKSQQFITNNKRASYSGKPSYHVTDTIRLGTYQLFGAFFEAAVWLFSLSAICVHVPQCRSHLTPDPFSGFPSLLPPFRTQFCPNSSSSFPRISIGTQKQKNKSPSALSLLPSSLLCRPPATLSSFQMWKQNNFDLALYSHSTTRTSSLPTFFLTAETGNLLLACSVVLNCVTGTKWVPV